MLRMLRREDRRLLTGRAALTRGTWPDVVTVDPDVHCRVRPSLRHTVEVSSGGEQVALSVYDVRVPYETDIRRGDVLTLTRSADALQVGWWTTVVEVVVDEWVTTRIAVCHTSRGTT